jgi:hypothetical protein
MTLNEVHVESLKTLAFRSSQIDLNVRVMKELVVLASDIEKLATEEVHQAGIVLCPLGIGKLQYQAPLKKLHKIYVIKYMLLPLFIGVILNKYFKIDYIPTYMSKLTYKNTYRYIHLQKKLKGLTLVNGGVILYTFSMFIIIPIIFSGLRGEAPSRAR